MMALHPGAKRRKRKTSKMTKEQINKIKDIMALYQNKKKDMRAVRNIIGKVNRVGVFKWVLYKPYFSHDPHQNNQDLSIIVEDYGGHKRMFTVTSKFGTSSRSV